MSWTDRLTGGSIPTPRMLRLLRVALVVTVVATLLGGLSTFLGAYRTAGAVADDVVPSVAAVSAVWRQLRDADARISGCRIDPAGGGDTVDCAGVLASGEYRDIVADAVQRLAVLAERDVGDAADRRVLRVAQGLLIRYLGLIEQANLSLSRGQGVLAEAFLRYAKDLLHDTVLTELDMYRRVIDEELAEQRESAWRAPATAFLWLLPLVFGLSLLVLTQLYLAARFRRRLNVPLAIGTIGLVGLGLVAGQPVLTGGRFARAATDLERLVNAPATEVSLPAAPESRLVDLTHAAADSHSLQYLMPVLALALLALIVAGFRDRLREYEFEAS
ncbi:hypothetical protein [Phytohabitans rumicis]|uniref:Uncharacterized protein n=1 Tax=Phytohabitans rumicis TaxID=1076125 RepID=A0A6V8LG44_9ACTN|nr:hypothetical protein [Phytohabitans rumicis]GFJ93848.1 hypothetical protein Prum_074900 [Phytohabitans rumicis]